VPRGSFTEKSLAGVKEFFTVSRREPREIAQEGCESNGLKGKLRRGGRQGYQSDLQKVGARESYSERLAIKVTTMGAPPIRLGIKFLGMTKKRGKRFYAQEI